MNLFNSLRSLFILIYLIYKIRKKIRYLRNNKDVFINRIRRRRIKI